MPVTPFLISLAFISLLSASLFDLKTREIPDWLSYSLIASALSIRFLNALIFNQWPLFFHPLIAGLILFGIGFLFYYTGHWGGGDAKLLLGLGIIFFSLRESFLLNFVINTLIIGSLYGISWSLYLAVKNWNKFIPPMRRFLIKYKKQRYFLLIISIIALLSLIMIKDSTLRIIILSSALFLILYSYLFIFVKAVEDACMFKTLPVSKLTEGDWIPESIYHKNKLLVKKTNTGLTKKDIEILRSNVKKVTVKEGIPFVPTFFLGFLATLLFNNLLLAA